VHDDNNGVSGFTSLIFNATPPRSVAAGQHRARRFFQVPNTSRQQASGIFATRNANATALNFSWVHTLQPGWLLTVSPFVHWNRADYNGFSPIPSLLPDQPAIPTDHNNSLYEGAQLSLAITAAPAQRAVGTYGFAQTGRLLVPRRRNDGSGLIASEKDSPSGGLFTLFAEDQFSRH